MRSPLHSLIDASKPHETCYGPDQRVIGIWQDGINVLELPEEEARKRARELNRSDRTRASEEALARAAREAREGGPDEPDTDLSPGKDARQTLEEMGITRGPARRNVRRPEPEVTRKPVEPPEPPVSARDLERHDRDRDRGEDR